MYVKATAEFMRCGAYPVELNYIPQEGTIFEVTEERFKTLSGGNRFGKVFVEELKTSKPQKKKGKKKNYKIAMIIPNCNYAKWIPKCLDSILSQTYKNYEIIFVDDMSTDDSVKVAQGMLDKPHKVVQLKQKRYTGGARNEAMLHLSKDVDYIFSIDSDDWLTSDKALEVINDGLQYQPDVLFMGVTEHKGGKEQICRVPLYEDRYQAFEGWSGCGKVIKRELQEKCLYAEGTLKEDKNHHCRICFYMDDFVCIPDAFYLWNRDNTGSVTTVREKIKWGTSTIRHWADTLELALEVQGKDSIIDRYMAERLRKVRQEVERGGDRQF